MTAIDRLRHLARRWRRLRLVELAASVAATALVLGVGVGGALEWSPAIRLVVAVVSAAAVFLWRRHRVPPAGDAERLVAGHVDRTLLHIEDSCGLLLAEETSLTGVAQLQRARAARVLEAEGAGIRVPARPLANAAGIGAGSFALTAALLLVGTAPEGPGSTQRRPEARGAAAAASRAQIVPTGVEVEAIPPAYTRLAPRTTAALDVTVEEGSQVRWAVTFDGAPDAVHLIFAGGDTLPLTASAGRYTGGKRFEEPTVYTLAARAPDGTAYRSRFHRLDVVADGAPRITVVHPAESRTTASGGARVAVRTVIEDDYGVTDAALVATLARGSGENVRFREVRVPFAAPVTGERPMVDLTATLDLGALGLEPGDELYFYVSGRDNRRPSANVARSDAYFLVVPDTGRVAMASLDGIAVSLLPEYFRSQRQIIIDTEGLIAERGALAPSDVGRRSNNIGLDQKALRLRYGQFIGEEDNSGIEGGDLPEDDAEHEGEDPGPGRGDAAARMDAALEPFRHTHDTEAIATFFSDEIRERLKAVLAQMWEAEMRLRTARPEAALPYEYQALELLKELQQAARVYVLRVGFDPPPLRPDETRLTGDLDGVRDRSARRTVANRPSFPEVRAALRVLDSLEGGGRAQGIDPAPLERAGRVLAGEAGADALLYVEALGALRRLLDQFESGDVSCRPCISAARRGLWMLLPRSPAAEAPPAAPVGALSARYFELLRRTR